MVQYKKGRQKHYQPKNMMGYGYDGVMGGAGTLGFLTWLVVLVDLVLVGIWLWKQISR